MDVDTGLQPSSQEGNKSQLWKDEQMYFRRMVVVWEPIWNYVYRHLLCRCLIFRENERSRATELHISVLSLCPNHTPAWFHDRVKDLNLLRPPDQDHYFDRFGGYQQFCRHAQYLGGPFSSLFMDADKLQASQPVQTGPLESRIQCEFDKYGEDVYLECQDFLQQQDGGKSNMDADILQAMEEYQQSLRETRPELIEAEVQRDQTRATTKRLQAAMPAEYCE